MTLNDKQEDQKTKTPGERNTRIQNNNAFYDTPPSLFSFPPDEGAALLLVAPVGSFFAASARLCRFV